MKSPFNVACSLIFTGIFVASNLYIMLPLQSTLATTFRVSIPMVSLMSSMFIFPYAIGLFAFGLLADRLPYKNLLVVGMLLLSVITAVIGLTTNFFVLLIFRALQGILAASFAPTAFSYTFEHFQGKWHGLVIAMINAGFLFAGVSGQMLSVEIASYYSYKGVFFFLAFIYLLSFFWMMATLDVSTTKKWSKVSLTPILSFFRHQQLRKLYLIAFFLLFTMMFFYGSFELYIAGDHHLNFPFPLQVVRLISLVGIIPSFFSGYMKARYGASRVLIVYLGVMSVSCFIPLVVLNSWTILIGSIGLITSTSVTIPMVILLIGQYGREARASAIAIYSFTLLTGASIGGAMATVVSFPWVLGFTVVIFGMLSVVAYTIRNSPRLIE